VNFNPSQTAVTFETINNYGVILGLKILFQEQIITFFKTSKLYKTDITDSYGLAHYCAHFANQI